MAINGSRALWLKLSGLCIATIMMVIAIRKSVLPFYDKFFHGIEPLWVFGVTILAGLFSLNYLLGNAALRSISVTRKTSFTNSLLLTAVFASVSIFIDWRISLPKDINVLFPLSLLFYPSIALLVEFLFHIIPLALLFTFFSRQQGQQATNKKIAFGFLLVATLEPSFQVLLGMGEYPLWAPVLLWINLYLFNLVQLLIFSSSGFFPMYLLRLVFYLIWHILWGYERLQLLF